MNDLLDLILTPLDGERSGEVRWRLERCRNDPEAQDDDFYIFREALQDVPDEFLPTWWLDPARCRWWLCLHVDWKAYDEVAWQVQAISRTLGLETGFVSEAEAQWNTYFENLHPGSRGGRALNVTGLEMDEGPGASRPSMMHSLRAGLNNIRKAVRRASLAELPRPVQPPSSGAPTLDVLSDGADWLRERGYELLFLDTGGDEYLAVPVRLGLLAQTRAAAEHLNLPTFLV